MKKYIPAKIESKWREIWAKSNLYKFDLGQDKDKFYNLVELPYPSGDLHLGHWFAFVPPDVLARFKRMSGFNVFFPNGYDAFGLPAENAAIKRGIHPKDWTLSNIKTMTRQFQTMGTMIDWSHQAITCLPDYYRWNQWIFLRMFEKGLAYRGKTLSNWCEYDQTVLANENVEAGRCWRCGNPVIQREVEQWFLKITEYADQLIWPQNPQVDWPKSVMDGQNTWIGKSEGVEIEFKIQNSKFKINTYTVFPETIFGVTYMVLAPEHLLITKITKKDYKKDVENYIKVSKNKTELERKENKEKTGVFTGSYVINPANDQKVPVWVSDYVIWGYGTGAVMGVPGSDHRDFEFAKKYNLPVVKVIAEHEKDISPVRSQEEVLEEGVLVNSEKFSGLSTPEPGREKIKQWMIEKGFGKRKVQYHIHDWSISRQRYWGTPVPIIHCPDCGLVPVPDKDLPVELPYDVDFTPKGKPPLASNEEWLRVKCPNCGREAKRDAETLDTFFDSSWYFLRYLDPDYEKGPFDTALAKKLMPVDIYFGGAEHTLGHTLYARFFTKFFKDLRLIDFDEFALKRVQHGVILGPDGYRMSKSRGNVVNPDDVVKEYGADTVRLYLCFMMPYYAVAPWSPSAINGTYRFLKRVWDLLDKVDPKIKLTKPDLIQLNKTIKKVEEDINKTNFNTAVASLMQWLNYLSIKVKITKNEYETYLKLLAPFVPHISEELWHELGEKESIHLQSWPEINQDYLKEEKVNIAVQVNGKVRDVIAVSSDILEKENDIVALALSSSKVKKYLEGKKPKKVIYKAGKILSLVI